MGEGGQLSDLPTAEQTPWERAGQFGHAGRSGLGSKTISVCEDVRQLAIAERFRRLTHFVLPKAVPRPGQSSSRSRSTSEPPARLLAIAERYRCRRMAAPSPVRAPEPPAPGPEGGSPLSSKVGSQAGSQDGAEAKRSEIDVEEIDVAADSDRVPAPNMQEELAGRRREAIKKAAGRHEQMEQRGNLELRLKKLCVTGTGPALTFFEQMGIRNTRAFNGFGDTSSQAESEKAVELTVAFERWMIQSGVAEWDRAKLGPVGVGAHGQEEEEEPEEEEPETGEPEELPEALVGVARGPAGAAAELAPL